VIEEDAAHISLVQGCPYPYLAAESLSGAKEIWWFNGYRSPAAQKQVADAYATNTRLLSSRQRYLVVRSTQTRDAADRLAECDSNVLQVRPTFSFPAPEWIASDASFWARGL
jgi:hypothetical protein